MSTNKTQNYALHSWLPTDDFQLSEVNQNFAAIDVALCGQYTLVTGSYAGNGTDTRRFNFSGPVALFILENTEGRRACLGQVPMYGGLILPGVPMAENYCRISANSVVIKNNGTARLNESGTTYLYLALVENE